MPYSITTKDGITIQNIPDDVAPDSPELKQRVAAVRGKSSGVSTVEGLAIGAADPIHGSAQLLEESLPKSITGPVNRFNNRLADLGLPLARVPEENAVSHIVAQREADIQARRAAAGQTGVDVPRALGNVASSLFLTRGINAPATLAGRTAQGAALGGGLSAAAPVTDPGDFFKQKSEQVTTGAIAGGVLPLGVGALSRVIKPNTRPEAEALLKQGVTPTPGQILGGQAQVVEEKFTSLPILGDAIRSSKGKALDEFNRAVYARALAPIGGKVPKEVGHDGVSAVREQLDAAYNKLLPNVGFKADDQFNTGVKELRGLVSTLPKQQSGQFERIYNIHLKNKMTSSGLMSGERLKEVEGELGRLASGYSKDSAFDNRELGRALTQLQTLIRENLARNNPSYAEELKRINTGWANYTRIRDAASRQGSQDGRFTPAQLSAAVRAGDKTVGKRAFSEGDALLQDLSGAGKNVLGLKYPDSGTAGRLMLGTGAAGASYFISPELLLATGLSTVPFLPGGRQVAAGLLARRPQAAGLLANRVRALTPAAAASGGLLAAE